MLLTSMVKAHQWTDQIHNLVHPLKTEYSVEWCAKKNLHNGTDCLNLKFEDQIRAQIKNLCLMITDLSVCSSIFSYILSRSLWSYR